MKKAVFAIAFIFASINAINAQQLGANISWDESTFNFGDVPEEQGKITHRFDFTNTGNEPLVITNVRPSCGCTTSDYTKEPVAPGQKGYVSASFDPNRRVGNNSKSITVTSNGNTPTSTLRFTVNVIAKPNSVEDDYPRTIGELRLKTNHLALMNVNTNEIKEGELEIMNTNAFDLNITFRNVPSHIEIKAVPETLKPNMAGKIIVKYNAAKKNDFGFLMDRVPVAINGNTDQNNYNISISATIEEDFSKLSAEEKAKAPKMEFESKVFDFGTIEQGANVDYTFNFKNTGKSDLMIRKTSASCGCTIVTPSKNVIKAGDSANLKVRFNSAGKVNKQNKTITIITNDPAEPQVVLRVTGFVNEPQKN